LTKIPDNK